MQHMAELLTELVERSSSLYERQGPDFQAPVSVSGREEEEVSARLVRWKEQGPKGNKDFFARRLVWGGWNEVTVRATLARPRYTGKALPRWALLLEQVLLLADRDLVAGNCFETAEPIAFEEVLISFVQVAERQLVDLSGNFADVLSERARKDLARLLLRTLSLAAEKALYSDFVGWRAMPELSPLREDKRPLYSSYVHSMRNGGLEHLLRSYPVLARLLGEITQQWVENTRLFAEQFRQDRTCLAEVLFGGQDPGCVQRITYGISDRHRGGKTVWEIHFEEVRSCFYKPRDCRPEVLFNDLLTWVRTKDTDCRLSSYRVVNRVTHGWVEKVHATRCEGLTECCSFYRQCGMLIGLLYALEASDCNFENILVSHGVPVLIDAETLLQPRPRSDGADLWRALSAATEQMYYDSVLRLHFLPQWTARPSGEKADVSGLGSGPGNRGTTRKKTWTRINHDDMAMRWETVVLDPDEGPGAYVNGSRVRPSDYLSEILSGFEWMYRFLVTARDELWETTGPLRAFVNVPSRIVIRNTFIYVGLRNVLTDPKVLRDGVDASIALDHLTRLYADAETKPRSWPVVQAEVFSLLRADIPSFHTSSASDALYLDNGECIPAYFTEPADVMFRRRFFAMSEDDLDLQSRYIRSAFGHFEEVTPRSEPIVSCSFQQRETTESEQPMLTAEVLRLARAICSQAIRATDGSISWISQVYNADSQFYETKPIGLFLYDGIGGIGLFLAAVEAALGTTEFSETTAAIERMLCDVSSSRMQYHLDREGLGAGLGTPSLAYCLTRIAVFRKDEQLLSAALDLMRRLTPDMVAQDRRLDLIGGSAGCLLVLLALHAVSPQPWLLDLACACGEHLLSKRSVSPVGLTAWKTIRGNHLAGFSHGAAGIGGALAKLYEATSLERYRTAAVQAVTYEASLYSPAEKNWPNLLLPLKDGGYSHWNAWCHGAPGIGLGRLMSLNAVDGRQAETHLEDALAKAGSLELGNLDNVCCGNFGRIELLLEASLVLQRPDYLQRSRDIAGFAMKRAAAATDYVAGVRDGIYVPSFHQGMAGIGFQLLRLTNAGAMPSVMSWQ